MNLPDRLISADDHLDLAALPPDLFTERVDRQFREAAPHVVELDGANWWVIGDLKVESSGFRETGFVQTTKATRPGVVQTRLEDMDLDGVYAQVLYGLANWPYFGVTDPDLEAECARVYNDWGVEFSRQSPERLILLGIVPADNPEFATSEALRLAREGVRGILISHYPTEVPVWNESWNRFWDVLAETGLPAHIHIGIGQHSIVRVPRSWQQPAKSSSAATQIEEMMAGLIFSGVLDRRPTVKVVLAECGYGWVPFMLEEWTRCTTNTTTFQRTYS